MPTNAPILNTGRIIEGADTNVLPENTRPTPRGAPIRLHTGVISVPVVGTVTCDAIAPRAILPAPRVPDT